MKAGQSQNAETHGVVDLLLLSTVLIWGTNFSIIKYAYGYLHPIAFNAVRFVITCSAMLAVVRWRGVNLKFDRADLPAIVCLGLLGNYFYQFLFVLGLAYTKAGNGGLLMSMTPIFAYMIGLWTRHERFRPGVLLGILISLAGVFSIVLFGRAEVSFGPTWRGDLLIICSAVCWGAYSALSAHLLPKYGAIRLTAMAMVVGTVFLIPTSVPWLLTQDWSRVTPVVWLSVLFSALLAIVFSYFAWSYAISKVGVAKTSVFSNLTPIFALLAAWAMVGERPVPSQLVGVVLILFGVFLVRNLKKMSTPDALETQSSGT